MNTSKLWVVCAGVVGLTLLGGCTTQPRRVSCEGRLEPINAPAPKVAESLDKRLPQKASPRGQVAP